MDWRTALYVLIGLLYVGYPLFYITSKRDVGKTRVLAMGLVLYGLLGTFWHDMHTVPVAVVSSMMIAFGLGLYLRVVSECFLWLLAIGYSILLLTWPTYLDPLIDLAAAFLVVVGFDRCIAAARRKQTV
jgi:hypothetical protein